MEGKEKIETLLRQFLATPLVDFTRGKCLHNLKRNKIEEINYCS